MISLIDRYILRALLVNYVIALAVMISLYVTLDMFVNMDEFTEHGYSISVVMGNIFSYYWPNVFLYFSQLSGAITLFSCMAVLARMRRLNELTAILASGVSLFRVAQPIAAFGIGTSALLVVDTEVVIPAIAHLLARDHDDADGSRAYEVLFLEDKDGGLLSAGEFNPADKRLQRLLVIHRNEYGAIDETIEADAADWEPVPQRWRLQRGVKTRRVQLDTGSLAPRDSVTESIVKYYPSELDPDEILLRQAEGWIEFLSLAELREQEQSGRADHLAVRQARWNRLSAPIISMLLLALGLPFFLDRSPANVLSDAGKCLLACGLLFVTHFVSQGIRPDAGSSLIGWLPILIFLPIAVALIDRIRT